MEVLYDPVKRERAEVYHRRKTRHDWTTRITTVLGAVIFFGLGWEYPVYEFLAGWTDSSRLRIAGYIGGIFLAGWVLDTVYSYFTVYQTQRRFRLSTQTPGAWLADQVKYLFLGLIFTVLAGRGLQIIMDIYPATWWIYVTIGAFIFHGLMAFLMPVILVPLFYKLKPYPESSLRTRLERLFIRVGVRVTDIYEINLSAKTTTSNAAVMGMGKTRKIVLGDTLRDRYTDGEIEAIMAHEIGHHVHKDIFKLIVSNLCGFLAVSFVTAQVWPQIAEWKGYGTAVDPVGLPLLLVVMSVIYRLVTPLQMWYSRHLERQADAFSLNLIEHPRDLAMAFVKLADDSLSRLRPDWFTLAFRASHPPIGERVERALKWKKQR